MTDNERWLTDGDCSKCRKANYCSKDCKAHNNRLGDIMRKAFMDVMEEKNQGYKKLMEKIEDNYEARY